MTTAAPPRQAERPPAAVACAHSRQARRAARRRGRVHAFAAISPGAPRRERRWHERYLTRPENPAPPDHPAEVTRSRNLTADFTARFRDRTRPPTRHRQAAKTAEHLLTALAALVVLLGRQLRRLHRTAAAIVAAPLVVLRAVLRARRHRPRHADPWQHLRRLIFTRATLTAAPPATLAGAVAPWRSLSAA